MNESQRIYETYRVELLQREISNAESLDKSILTYSSSGLALSLVFLKDFVPFARAKLPGLLIGSWFLFTIAVVTVILSYIFSQVVIRRQLKQAEDYYINKGQMVPEGLLHTWTLHLNLWVSAAAFIGAIVLTTLFVSINLGAPEMITNNSQRSTNEPVGALQKGSIGLPAQAIQPKAPAPTPAPAAAPAPAKPK